MSIEIYLDSGSLADIERLIDDPRIKGVTTNPSILKKAGISDYRTFAKTVLSLVKGKPVSFEVLADDFQTMEKQAREIASWGENVYVKIPITNTKGESSRGLIERIADINLNITAVMCLDQFWSIGELIKPNHIVSFFVGRINDTGRHQPQPSRIFGRPSPKFLWASARQVYSVVAAENYGYDIITLTPELIAKLSLFGKDLTEYSRETIKQFHEDGKGIEF